MAGIKGFAAVPRQAPGTSTAPTLKPVQGAYTPHQLESRMFSQSNRDISRPKVPGGLAPEQRAIQSPLKSTMTPVKIPGTKGGI